MGRLIRKSLKHKEIPCNILMNACITLSYLRCLVWNMGYDRSSVTLLVLRVNQSVDPMMRLKTPGPLINQVLLLTIFTSSKAAASNTCLHYAALHMQIIV